MADVPSPQAPLERRTLRDLAESSLRDLIANGELETGTRLNEVALAAQLGISRGPLREAIQGLAREGLLEVIRHRGAFVRTVDARALRDLYELRVALESYAVSLLGRREDRSAVAELAELVAEAERTLEQVDEGYPTDADFHRSLFRLVGNDALASAAEDVQTRISLARVRSARNPERARTALAEHRAVVTALAEGQADHAVALHEAHLWSSYESALAALGAGS